MKQNTFPVKATARNSPLKGVLDMTSLEYLTQLKRLHDLIEEEQADLEDEREELESGSDLPTTGKEAFLKRLEILERINDKHREFYPRLQNRLKSKIHTLNIVRERNVLVLRYVDLLEWDEIAEKMHGSKDAAYGVHKRALKHLEV